MKPEEAIHHLHTYSSTLGSGQTTERQHEEAKKMAIEALEKQIPKKPTEGFVFQEGFRNMLAKKNPDMASITGSCCPTCGRHIGETEHVLKKKNYMPYCKWCGQALKQPEDNDET